MVTKYDYNWKLHDIQKDQLNMILFVRNPFSKFFGWLHSLITDEDNIYGPGIF